MAETSDSKTPNAWEQKVAIANAESETVNKCSKSIKNTQNSRKKCI